MSSVVTMFGIMLSGYDLELFSSSHNPIGEYVCQSSTDCAANIYPNATYLSLQIK